MNLPSDTSRDRFTLEPGTLLDGRYEIRQLLGKGGFAKVYLAHHIHLDRLCALKILDLPTRPEAREQFSKRFIQEARIAVKIKHPNVVDIYDFGISSEHGPYISMEYLEGHDLEVEIESNGSMDIGRAIRLFAPSLRAIAQGHVQNIAHKDLKPSNLFVVHPGTLEERMVVLDFGIARLFGASEVRMTQTGSFSGTPAYLAPEYIEKQLVTPALDVYQMGLIFIEAITAAPAVEGESGMALMIAHCQGQVAIPHELDGTSLGKILRKATMLDPQKRFAEAGEFAVELESLVSIPTIPPRPSSSRESALGISSNTKRAVSLQRPVIQHSSRTLFLLIVAFLVTSLLLVLVWSLRTQDKPSPPEAQAHEAISTRAELVTPQIVDPARERVLAALSFAASATPEAKEAKEIEKSVATVEREPPKRNRNSEKPKPRTQSKAKPPPPKAVPPELAPDPPQIAPAPKQVDLSTPQPTIMD